MRRPSIRISYTAGPVSRARELVLICGYSDADARDRDLERLAGISGQPITPWSFSATDADRYDADLYAAAAEVSAATEHLGQDGLLHDPASLLKLLRDPTEPVRDWYSEPLT